MQVTVVFLMLIKHGIAGQRAVDKERQKKREQTGQKEGEGGMNKQRAGRQERRGNKK